MFIYFIYIVIGILTIYIFKWKRDHDTFWKHIMAIPGPTMYPLVGCIGELGNPGQEAITLSKTTKPFSVRTRFQFTICPFLNIFNILYWWLQDSVLKAAVFTRDRRRALEHHPIFKLHVLNITFVAFITPEDMELILTNMNHLAKSDTYSFLHQWLATGLLTSDGAKWQNRRKILTPAFHFSILQEFIDIFNRETRNLVDVLEKQCHQNYIDVLKPITQFTLYSIGETSLGVNFNEDSRCAAYKDAVYDIGECFTYRIVQPWYHYQFLYNMTATSRKEKKCLNVLHNFSNNVIEERKKLFNDGNISYSGRKRMAMLDLLLSAKYGGANINDEGIREEVDTFMFEGHDTTAMAICFVLLTLANEKDFQEQVRQEVIDLLGDSDKTPTYNDLVELKFMERCIKECMRIYPSVPFIARKCGEEFKSATGYTIPKGTNLFMYIIDMHKNPHVWENPEKFDPDRFLPENTAKRHPFAYLPFSAGPRNCIGQKYAMLEIKAALCGILRKFNLEPYDKPEDVQFKIDLVLRPVGEIRVKFVPRGIDR